MCVVNISQAKTQLSQLLARAEAGEDVVITRRGEPVVRLVACKPKSARQPDVLPESKTIDHGLGWVEYRNGYAVDPASLNAE